MLVPKWWPNKAPKFQPFSCASLPKIHVPQRITMVNFCVPRMIGNMDSVIAIHSVFMRSQRELRIYHVPIWEESPLFTDKEKAAFEWTKAVTLISQGPVSEELFQKMKQHFSEQEIVDLNMQIAFINLFNRFAATFRSVPGARDQVLGLGKANLS